MTLKSVPLDCAQKFICELRKKFYFNREIEESDIDSSLGRELAEPIISRYESPAHDIATMDGFAVNHKDHYPLKIIGEVYAGDDSRIEIKRGECVKIATGAKLPKSADAVLKIEDAVVKDGKLYGISLKKWNYVIRAGSDYKKGDIVLEKKHRIRPQEIAILHGVSASRIRIYKKPRIAVFSTGDEIYKGQIRDTNAPMICAFLRDWNCEPVPLGNVPDDFELTKEKIIEGMEFDAVITSGGVSVGKRDYVYKAIEDLGDLLIHKVTTRPGKPMAVGVVNKKPIFGLPGKPTGAFTAMELCVKPYFLNSNGIPENKNNKQYKIARDITIPNKDFAHIVFGKVKDTHLYPIESPCYSSAESNTTVIASSLKSSIADGYAIVENDLQKGDVVNVNLF